ncbi:DUF7562 family protein [Halobellus sp. EA9]|uniref:DUF7562 family protein n=1 Tax=Halobellus sp. EA9 TaxID=3421647 RepID=UPI003EBD52C0
MWRSRNNRDETTVVCIACGTSLARSEAREYDKHGNRWERHGKSFEHLCKECYRDLCHQPRGDLEALLVDLEREAAFDTAADAESIDGAGDDADHSRVQFLSRYYEAVEERSNSAEERNES